jgi:hypothetical protein
LDRPIQADYLEALKTKKDLHSTRTFPWGRLVVDVTSMPFRNAHLES